MGVYEHVMPLLRLSSPIFLTQIFQQLMGVVTMIYVGRLGKLYMGAASLAQMLCNITGFSLGIGMLSAMDTFLSQAFGARKYKLMGLIVQRGVLILTVFSIPIFFVWRNCTYTFLHDVLGINDTQSRISESYARHLSVGLWPNLMFEILKRFLQCQNIIYPIMLSTLIGLVFNILMNYELAVRRGWGVDGCAITVACQGWVILAALVATTLLRRRAVLAGRGAAGVVTGSVQYSALGIDSPPCDDAEKSNSGSSSNNNNDSSGSGSTDIEKCACSDASENDEFLASPSKDSRRQYIAEAEEPEGPLESDPEDNWPAPSSAAFCDWLPFLRLGVPGALSLFIEWGSFEMAAGIAGRMSTAELATHSLYMQTAGMFYMFPLAIANSVSILLGNYIGRQEYQRARELISLGLTADFLIGFISGSLLLLLRQQWGLIFSSDADVDRLVDANMAAMFLYSIVDASKCVCLNILRSSGSPMVTVFFNFFACVVVLLPLGYYLGIVRHYGVFGLWIAMSVAWLLCTAVYLALILRTDWEAQNFVKDSRGSETGDGLEMKKKEEEEPVAAVGGCDDRAV